MSQSKIEGKLILISESECESGEWDINFAAMPEKDRGALGEGKENHGLRRMRRRYRNRVAQEVFFIALS